MNDSRRAPILIAARKGCVRCTDALLESGVDIDFQDNPDRRNALINALRFDNLDAFKVLLANGADPTLQSIDDGTPDAIAYSALESSKFNILKEFVSEDTLIDWAHKNPWRFAWFNDEIFLYFVSLGIDVNKNLSEHSDTTLLVASLHSASRVACLIDKGADVNLANKCGLSPLHLACRYRVTEGEKDSDITDEQQHKINDRVKVIELLISSGANIASQYISKVSDTYNLFPIEDASDSGLEAAVTLLEKAFKALPNDKVDAFLAVTMDDIGAIHKVYNTNGHVNFRNQYNWTPLHVAAMKSNTNMIYQLVSLGADINSKNDEGWPPLHFAQEKKSVKLLLELGADVNSSDNHGYSRIHLAAQWGETLVTEELLRFNPKLDIKNHYGLTPLMEAVQKNQIEAAKRILAKSSSKLRSSGGYDLLKYATLNCSLPMLKLLKVNGITFQNTHLDDAFLHLASYRHHAPPKEDIESVVLMLEDEGLDINMVDSDGRTALYNSVFKAKNYRIALVLMQHGGKYSGLSLDQIAWLSERKMDPASATFIQSIYDNKQ